MEKFKKILIDFLKGVTSAEQAQVSLAQFILEQPDQTQNCIAQLNHLYSTRRLIPQHYSMFRDALTKPHAIDQSDPNQAPSTTRGSTSAISSDPQTFSTSQGPDDDSIESNENLDPLAAFDAVSKSGISLVSSSSQSESESTDSNDGESAIDDEAADKTVYRIPTQQTTSNDSVPQNKPQSSDHSDEDHDENPEATRFRPQTTGHKSQTGAVRTGTHAPFTGTSASWGNPSSWTSTGEASTGVPLTTGSIIKERFVLEDMLGRGGMGTVYKARDLRKEEAQDRNPYVALKVLNEEFKKHPESLKALQRESRKAQQLAHPNIVNVHDFDRDGGNVYMTMELLEGQPLDRLIRRRKGTGMVWSEAIPIIKQMSEALSTAHAKHIVHSDFKPGNCFLTNDGVVKVFDFGIARAAKRTGELKGEVTKFDAGTLGALTPAYATCEMIDGKEPDQRDDVYALACSSYELLAGVHPFAKLSAADALKKGLKVKPIKGLSRTQMKALEHGLALTRGKRTPTASRFFKEMNPRASNKWLKVGGGAAAIIALVVLSLIVVPNYLYSRNLEAVSVGLQSSEFEQISDALARLNELEPNDRQILLGNSSDQIIATYDKQIGKAFNRDAQLYDYPTARELLNELTSLYKDSSRVVTIQEQIEKDRQELQAEWSDAYDAFLETRQLLATSGPDIYDLRDALSQVDPDDPLLTDARLPQALAFEAETAAEAKQFDLAQQYITAGLELAPNDSNLVNVQDEVNTQRNAIERAAEIAALESNIKHLGVRRLDPEDIEDLGVRKDLQELSELQPNSIALKEARTRIRAMVTKHVNGELVERNWDEAGLFLVQIEGFMEQGYIETQIEIIEQSRREFKDTIDTLLASLDKAIAEGRLDGSSNNSAMSQLAKLRTSGADPSVIATANDQVAIGYINSARLARSKNEWDDARAIAGKAIELEPSSSILADVQSEISKVNNQETLAVQELRAQEISDMQSRIDRRLAQATFDKGDIEAVATQLNDLEDKFGSEVEVSSFLDQAQSRVAERVSIAALASAREARWDAANDLIVAGEQSIGRQSSLTEARTEISTIRRDQESRDQQEKVRVSEERLAQMLQNAELNGAWNERFDRQLAELEKLESGNPYAIEARERAAQLHLQRAQELKNNDRWVVARQQLDRAQSLAPSLPSVVAELSVFEDGLASYEQRLADNKELAEVKAKRELFNRQLQANQLERAGQTLSELAKLIDKDDEFVTTQAPKVLVDGYLQTAATSAGRDQYTRALQHVSSAQTYRTNDPRISAAKQRYTQQRRAYNAVRTGSADDLQQMGNILQQLQTSTPEFDKFKGRLQRAMKRRIEDLANSNRNSAQALLSAVQPAFPTLGIDWPNPAQSTPTESNPNVPVTQPRVEPKPPPISPSSASGKRCSASNAGRGRPTCYDQPTSNKDSRMPYLLVVPGVGGGQPFAISRSEISRKDFNLYCARSGECSSLGGPGSYPATNLSADQMQSYVRWLSAMTGKQYQLPSLDQWRHAARADGSALTPNMNCVRKMGGGQIAGMRLEDIKYGGAKEANAWGLRQVIGNAEEVVMLGEGYLAAGGAYSDRASNCTVDFTRPFSGANERSGFRVVRNID